MAQKEQKPYHELVKTYKERAKNRWDKVKAERKKLGFLAIPERFELWIKEDQDLKKWKATIKKVADDQSRRAQKRGYRYFKQLRRRRWVILIAIIAVVIPTTLLLAWYGNATKPLTPAQRTARTASLEVARKVQDEGMVLLRNEKNALPLTTKKVSVFGAGAARPVYGGGGAGGIAPTSVDSLYDALAKEGFAYDTSLYNLYSNFAFHQKASTDSFKKPGKDFFDVMLPSIKGFLATATPEMPADKLPQEVLDQATKHSDTAIYVVSRVGTETKDLTPEQLRLNSDEKATLAKLDANFKRIVLLVNTTNAMELGFVEDYKHIDAVLWVGAPGEVGSHSIAGALGGKVNPSGRLTDTYVYNLESNPAVANTGDFQYKNNDGSPSGRYFANYKEGVYVGYRYYETFVSDNDYGRVVQYPFGYGLSYTSFKWNVVNTSATEREIVAKVRVTNTGKVAGKDVVELYYDAPFTHGGIEKSATVLGGYAKTGLIQPGKSEEVTIRLATNSMASYDDTSAKAWVLDSGEYRLRIARDVRDTVDRFSYVQPERKVIKVDNTTGSQVTNRFDHARGDSTYLSRSNPGATMPHAPSGDDFTIPDSVKNSNYAHDAVARDEPVTGATNNIKLADLKGLAYDDPKWQQFLDQLTDEELVKLAGNGGYWSMAIDRLGVPRTTMYDGPASIRNFFQAWSTVAYPVPVVLSSTWNDTLAEEVGVAMGREAESFDVDAVYAPSLNLHRSPLGGRNFEYYSEDPLIAGRIGAAYTRGLQSTKRVAVIKHYAANDQETNRAAMGLYTWMTEQSLRELYLKPFELAVKDGDAHGAMSAFNRIGSVWAGGDPQLLNGVLREEWGFKGFVITDAGIAGQGDHFNALQAVEAGNDLMLGNLVDNGSGTFVQQLREYLGQDRAGTLTALRSAAHNICYYVLQTDKVK